MSSRTIYLFVLIFPLFLWACTSGTEPDLNDNRLNTIAHTTEVNIEQVTTNSVIVDYHGRLHNPCHEFGRVEFSLDEQVITTSVIMYSTSVYCIDILGYVNIPDLEIPVPGPGHWTLRFPRLGEQGPYEKELVIPYP